MVEASVLFSFTRVDNFHELLINRSDINTSLFDGVSNNFRIVLAENCDDNIRNCLNTDGTLSDEVVTIENDHPDNGLCAMLWSIGVNTNRSISIASNSVTYELGDDTFMLKGAFLVIESSGVVLAYSINNAPMPVSKSFTAPVDGMVWSITSKVYGE